MMMCMTSHKAVVMCMMSFEHGTPPSYYSTRPNCCCLLSRSQIMTDNLHTLIAYMDKGPSISVNIFMSVQTIHFREGGGFCENQNNFCILSTFWPDFYYFHWDFWHSKNVDVYSLVLGEGVSESVWLVHS